MKEAPGTPAPRAGELLPSAPSGSRDPEAHGRGPGQAGPAGGTRRSPASAAQDSGAVPCGRCCDPGTPAADGRGLSPVPLTHRTPPVRAGLGVH